MFVILTYPPAFSMTNLHSGISWITNIVNFKLTLSKVHALSTEFYYRDN